MGWGGGMLLNFPVASRWSINPELLFQWRKLYNNDYTANYPSPAKPMEVKIYASELALSIPVMVQYKFVPGFYVAGGMQIDVPFLAKIHQQDKVKGDDWNYCSAVRSIHQPDGIAECSSSYDRSSADFGLAIGTGYVFGKHFGIDLKFIAGLTQLDEREEGNRYHQLTFGLLWYF
jgi:hypothetical protein